MVERQAPQRVCRSAGFRGVPGSRPRDPHRRTGAPPEGAGCEGTDAGCDGTDWAGADWAGAGADCAGAACDGADCAGADCAGGAGTTRTGVAVGGTGVGVYVRSRSRASVPSARTSIVPGALRAGRGAFAYNAKCPNSATPFAPGKYSLGA